MLHSNTESFSWLRKAKADLLIRLAKRAGVSVFQCSPRHMPFHSAVMAKACPCPVTWSMHACT